MTLGTIRLELARTKEFPEGSARHGYEFEAPLDDEGRLDLDAWRTVKNRCTVRRFWEGEDDEAGHLMHGHSGVWYFSYRPGPDDDEPIFRFDQHRFVEGEYVSITEHDGVQRPFRIVRVS